MEALVSLAPGTALYAYEIPALATQYVTDAYNKVVSDNKVDTVNSSFGGSELGLGTSTVKAWDAIAEQGAAKGITFHASTGDDGGVVNAPACSPHFVAVGGTSFLIDDSGKYAGELAWQGSDGGVSQIFALPAWQKGVPGIVNSGRNLPDVAFDANPTTRIALYIFGSFYTEYDPGGGTSLASPIFGAAVTEIDQVQNKRMGLAGKALFRLWEKKGYGKGAGTLFHDVTQGSNQVNSAATGYDLVTGIGSMDVWNIAKAL